MRDKTKTPVPVNGECGAEADYWRTGLRAVLMETKELRFDSRLSLDDLALPLMDLVDALLEHPRLRDGGVGEVAGEQIPHSGMDLDRPIGQFSPLRIQGGMLGRELFTALIALVLVRCPYKGFSGHERGGLIADY